VALSLRRGTVTAIGERLEGLVRLEVDGDPCIAYPRLTGPVALGDDVVVNVQARRLDLGSGGFDVLYANLTRGLGLDPPSGAHVMKLPYTPLQHAVRHGEEDSEPARLDGRPVVCCSLHSQVVPVCAALRGLRVAYVQLPGGALPVSLSDAVRALAADGLLDVTIAVGACVDGDVACVSAAAALAWCGAQGFDAVVAAIGPGVVGTGSAWGHGGLDVADALLAAGTLGGRPILAVRYSDRDPRPRHRGVSHHTRSLLELVRKVEVAWPADGAAPAGLEQAVRVDTSRWRAAVARLPLSHMRRGVDDDPRFFEAAYAAGAFARSLSSAGGG
jgi:hypothetical protein